MKYALLVHYSQKQFDQRDDKAAMAAAKAYSDAFKLQAFLAEVRDLNHHISRQPSPCATESERSMMARMPRRKSFSPDLASLTCRIWRRH
jgi:hypothetical protein